MSGFSTGSMGVGASSLSGSVSGSLSGLVGGSGSLSMAGDVDVGLFVGLGGIWGRRECCVWWRDGGCRPGEFVSVASSVDVRGSEGVRVGSVGSAIDLSDGGLAY